MILHTWRDCYLWGTSALPHSPTPSLDVACLLQCLGNFSASGLFTAFNSPIPAFLQTKFLHLLQRRQKHEPIAYLTHNKEFYGLQFTLTSVCLFLAPQVNCSLSWHANTFLLTRPCLMWAQVVVVSLLLARSTVQTVGLLGLIVAKMHLLSRTSTRNATTAIMLLFSSKTFLPQLQNSAGVLVLSLPILLTFPLRKCVHFPLRCTITSPTAPCMPTICAFTIALLNWRCATIVNMR